jgi:hypothetical protein
MDERAGTTGNVRIVTPQRFHDCECERENDGDNRPSAPSEGMSSQELADFQHEFSEWSRQRILTDGLKQYDRGDRQAFEDLDFPTLIEMAHEELADLVNYAAMLAIKLERLRECI